MAFYGNNDNEASKPNWLTEDQKRQCFRTIRGWEIPLAGFNPTGGVNINGVTGGTANQYILRSSNYIGPTELLVALPLDPSVTGATQSNYAGWSVDGVGRGASHDQFRGGTSAQDLPNNTPYFTTPANGTTIQYTRGITAYIPMIAADANLTDLPTALVFSITGPNTITGFSFTLISGVTAGTFAVIASPTGATYTASTNPTLATVQSLWFNQSTTLTGTSATGYYDRTVVNGYVPLNQYGGVGGFSGGAAILRVFSATGSTGTYSGFTASVFDGRASGGKTGTSAFSFLIS